MADGKVVIDIEADSSGFESEISGLDDEAKKAAGGMDELGDSARDAADGMGAADVAVGTFIANGVSSLVSAVGDAVSAIVGLADSTREYREDMAKLNTAFTTTGSSADTAKSVYADFYKILGESDRSVEAANHLAELTSNEQELAQWSTIAAGVTAKFGDSLPIEGLTEAANETAKVGKVTGPLADALNWAGISEEEFNAKLAECNSEQERATLITETLNNEYAAAAEEYNKLTASTQDAREATMNLEEAQADLGAAIEPVTTAWTNLKAGALQWLVDVGLPALQSGWQWVSDNLPTVAAIVVGLAAAWLAFGGAQTLAAAATAVVTAAQTALNVVMNANPIGLVILLITALVAAFIYLWNNCEAFRNFWISLWEGIKVVAADIWAAIVAVFQGAWEGIKAIWDLVSPYFLAVWETIKGIFAVVKAVLSGNFSDAWIAIKGIVNVWASYFSGVWSKIKGVFAVVGEWFRGIFQGAYTAITNIWDSISGYFSDLYDDITGAFDNILDDFFSVGDNIITGIWNGLSAGWDWLTGKAKELATSIFNAAKGALGIESPSKKFRWIGEMSAEGVGVGFDKSLPDIEKQLAGDLDGLTARVQSAVSVESSKVGRNISRPDTGYSELAQAVGMQTAGINSLSAQYRRGAANTRPIILELDGHELGRAVVNVGSVENSRIGTRLALGGAL